MRSVLLMFLQVATGHPQHNISWCQVTRPGETLFVCLFDSKSCSNHRVLLATLAFLVRVTFLILLVTCGAVSRTRAFLAQVDDKTTVWILNDSLRCGSDVHAEVIEQVLRPMWQSKLVHW